MTRQQKFRIAVRKFGPFESAIQKQWRSFDEIANTGLVLEAEAFDLHPLSQTLFENGGLTNGDWDVAFVNTDWIAAIEESKAAVDLTPYLQSDPPAGYPDAWSDSLLRLQQSNGVVLGLPYHDGPECLIYRKDLFEHPKEGAAYQGRFGVPLRIPQTWDEFRNVARFFQRPDRNLYGTAFAAYPDGHNTVYDFLLQLWTRGGELFDRTGQLCFNTPEAVEALAFYRSMLRDETAVHPRCRKMDSVRSGLAFAAGEVAMMVNWFGFAAMCETIAESRVKGCIEIAEIPHATGAAPVSLNIYWVLSIAAGSPHRDTAYRFLRHCANAAMDKLLTLEGGIGCRKSTWNDPDVNRLIPFYRDLESLHKGAREMPRLSRWPLVASLIDQLVLNSIDKQIPVDQLARQADSASRQLFKAAHTGN